MRFSITAAALPLALAAALVSTSAKADGAFLTFKDGAGQTIGTRAPVATFTAGTLQPPPLDAVLHPDPALPVGGGFYSPTTFEIDGVTNMLDYLQRVGVPLATVTVEFTTPNASGQEVVTSVGTFSGAMMKTADVIFDPSGLRGLFSFVFNDVAYTASTAGLATSERAVAVTAPRKLTGPLPVLTRSNVSRRPAVVTGAPTVDAAYLTLTPAQGSPLPAVQTGALKTAAFGLGHVMSMTQSGPVAGIVRTPLVVTRTHATTPIFQQSMSTGASWPTGRLSFVHTNADGTTTPVLHFNLQVARVRSDQASVSGGVSTETITLAYGGVSGYGDLAK
jgi:hypothetical protein